MQKETKTVYAEDGILIEYDHFKAGHSNLIVLAHGFYNSKQSVLLQDLGQNLIHDYDVIILDFRGHGKSRGLFCWASKEPMDLTALLKEVGKDYKKTAVIGFSFGAAVSMIVASQTNLIDNLIYVSGPSQYRKIDFRLWKLDFENDIIFNLFKGKGKGVRPGPFWLPKIQPLSIAPQLRIPVFYIHGDKDWVISPVHTQVLYEKTTSLKRFKVIKGGPHAEYLMREPFKEEFVAAIKSWLAETL